MSTVFRTLVALVLMTSCAMAQQNVVPITQLPNGGSLLSTDLIHIARCNHSGCDYQVTPGPLASAISPLSTTNGGTGLSTIGTAGTVLTSSGSYLYYAPSSGGGSGVSHQAFVSSGTTGPTVVIGTFIGWQSNSTGNKTQPIPASIGGLGEIIISDLVGNAGTYSITAVPLSGSIIGPNSVYTGYGSITLLDTSAGWISL